MMLTKIKFMFCCIVLLIVGSTASAETTFEKIKRTGKVTVGTEAAFPPFEFIQDGKIVGYGKDILNYVIANMDVELNQLDLPWQGILPGVLAGKFDFVATSVTMNEKRAKTYAFTAPIATSTTSLGIRDGDTSMSSVEDICGKVVGTQLASAGESAAREFDEKMGGDCYAELKLYTAYPEIYMALANGEIDAVVQSDTSLGVLMKEQPGVYKILGPIGTPGYFCWVTRPEDTDLRDYLSSQIYAMRDSGELAKSQDKWFGVRMEIPDDGYLPEGSL